MDSSRSAHSQRSPLAQRGRARILLSASLGLSLLLSACSVSSPGVSSPATPIPEEENPYRLSYSRLPDGGPVISCFEQGHGAYRTESCFIGSQDIPKDQLEPLDTLTTSWSFIESDGVTVICLEDGYGKNATLSCMPLEDSVRR